jgi:uncharacterized protein YndB with AHSA1/START domain
MGFNRERSMAMSERTHSSPRETSGTELVIERVWDAPRGVVWKYWTDPARMQRWWGPKGFTAPVIQTDLRPGGAYLACMRSPEGKDYWSTGVYREIVPEERLVMTDSFADEKGRVVPASYYGMSGDFPETFLVTVVFEALGDKTKMTLRHKGFPDRQHAEDTQNGWNESFDKLEKVLVPACTE